MEERDKDIITHNQAEDEIDIVEIIQKLWRNRKFILKVTAVFAILGLTVAISTPNVYTASCTMVPQTGQKSAGGSLGGLAAMAGINLGSLNSGEVLSPSVYPKIISNINFQKELIYLY
ncbi:MAG: Wzz/FepE/Etk N-terminal domain-containing protein [Bacteroidales bacterium]|nr:Wzz/FepE/Etk N-terminal domain-containing protein [Bacteroidales bacterium]